ncbi:MAG: uncharacterized membrane protein YgdD (TMEM256/DUF423 family) [Patescibacteria group bacterium]|jgi:uncharacterized membrane protein YgdD (TMEM256/DUF423 family)
MNFKKLTVLAVLLILSAIIFGAFGAHGLKAHLSPEKMDSLKTAIDYQLFHGLAILVLSLSSLKEDIIKVPSLLLVIGTGLFSGSIYLLSLKGLLGIEPPFVWALTPIGGTVLIFAWGLFIIKIAKSKA